MDLTNFLNKIKFIRETSLNANGNGVKFEYSYGATSLIYQINKSGTTNIYLQGYTPDNGFIRELLTVILQEKVKTQLTSFETSFELSL